MDDPAIKLYPDKNSGAWNWELMLRGKRIAYGESSDTQEAAYAAARQALAKERERRSKR
jgi:dsRNA-specific ribonuclease